MLPRFLPEEVFRLVERERVSELSLVPIMATALVNSPARSKYDLSSVEWAVIGGAASSPTLIREVETTLGHVNMPCFLRPLFRRGDRVGRSLRRCRFRRRKSERQSR